LETNSNKNEADIQRILEWSDTLELNREIDVQAHWEKVARKIAFLRFRKKVILFSRNAAAILLIPLIATTLWLLSTPNFNPPVEQIELWAAHGQIAKVTLPDSSEVWLNSGSKLIYPQRFSGDKRTVQLVGEAFFKVNADKEHRFDVEMPEGLVVSAYGTSFNIDSYEDDTSINMTLTSGQIEIFSPHSDTALVLQPGEQARYSKKDKLMNISAADLSSETAWKDGKIIFRRVSLDEIAKQLSRRFNVDIKLKDKELSDYEYSATFTTESLDEILHLLEKSAPVQYKIIEPQQNVDLTFSKRSIIIQKKKVKSNNE
jgi:ferric-dicitrate binding protein FerR (iron transport regulator)